jgi:5-methylcytosine-specific restriction protein A
MPTSPPLHRAAGTLFRIERRRAYDAERNRAHGVVYGHRWRKLRRAYLAAHPLCQCGECTCTPATVVHHRKPHHGAPALIYAWSNLQSLAKRCHDRITVLRDGGFGRAPVPSSPELCPHLPELGSPLLRARLAREAEAQRGSVVGAALPVEGIGGTKLKTVADLDRPPMDFSHSHIGKFWGQADTDHQPAEEPHHA